MDRSSRNRLTQKLLPKFSGDTLFDAIARAVCRAGRATDHMVRFLAEEFGVSSNDIQVVFGRMNVNKQLRIKAPKRLPAVIGQMELC